MVDPSEGCWPVTLRLRVFSDVNVLLSLSLLPLSKSMVAAFPTKAEPTKLNKPTTHSISTACLEFIRLHQHQHFNFTFSWILVPAAAWVKGHGSRNSGQLDTVNQSSFIARPGFGFERFNAWHYPCYPFHAQSCHESPLEPDSMFLVLSSFNFHLPPLVLDDVRPKQLDQNFILHHGY